VEQRRGERMNTEASAKQEGVFSFPQRLELKSTNTTQNDGYRYAFYVDDEQRTWVFDNKDFVQCDGPDHKQ